MSYRELCKRIIDDPCDLDRLGTDRLIPFLKGAADVFMREPNIIRLEGDVLYVGDIHGDIRSMTRAFALQKDAPMVFLGDVVDRGSSQMECVNLLLAHKLLDPEKVFYIRGNHEFKERNFRWGFTDAVMEHYPETVYWLYNACFVTLPLASLQNGNILGIHGGISRHVPTLKAIEDIERTSFASSDERISMLWNDPSEETNGYDTNFKRGVYFTFGRDIFDEFMRRNSLDLMVRAHQVWPDGYEYFFDRRLISVFSSNDHDKGVKPKAVLVRPDLSHEILTL